jgi:hypothetical protein
MGATAQNNEALNVEVHEPEVISPEDATNVVQDQQAKPVYDPEKMYTWAMDQTFSLTGQEFGILLNTVRAKVSTPEALEYRRLFACNDIIEQMMEKGVAQGIIVERANP